MYENLLKSISQRKYINIYLLIRLFDMLGDRDRERRLASLSLPLAYDRFSSRPSNLSKGKNIGNGKFMPRVKNLPFKVSQTIQGRQTWMHYLFFSRFRIHNILN